MKILKFTLTSFMVLCVFSLTLTAQNAQMVLMEEFTNASCGPCASQNPAYNTLIDANEANVVSIKWQWNFPGFDPFNDNNPTELDGRTAYYGINGVPVGVINGVIPDDSYAGGIGEWDIAGGGYEGGPYGYNQAVIDNAITFTTPLTMTMSHSVDLDAGTVTANLDITNTGTSDFTLSAGKVHVVLMEEEVVFPSAPGSNGEVDFTDVVIKMLTGLDGAALPTIAAGATYTVPTITESIPSYTYSALELKLAAFVQDDSDKAVYQATKSAPVTPSGTFADLALSSSTAAPAGLCGATLTPVLNVTNAGSDAVTAFNASYTINGGTPVVEMWTGSLAAGMSETVTFPTVTLPGGTSNVAYSVEPVGATDIASLNNQVPSESFAAISDTPIGSGYEEDNEAYDNLTYPAIALVDPPIAAGGFGWGSFTVVDQSALAAATESMGGYGNSEKAIWLNFYQWNPGEAIANATGSMTYDKISLVGVTNTVLSFDRSGGRYQTSNDGLTIEVSTDCGDTWAQVYSKSGADLSTVDTHTEALYVPTAGTWETDEIDLSAYDGAAEIIVRFTAISDWGNSTFLDNINLFNSVNNSHINLLEGVDVSVNPNPVVETANISLTLEEAKEMTISIFDVAGKLIRTLDSANFPAGQTNIEWDTNGEDGVPVAHGVYFVRTNSSQGQITKKVMVIR